jgi:signal transduction histidine kinase
MHDHAVQFYESDGFLVSAVADFIGTSLRRGGAGVVVATRAHRQALDERLRDDGFSLTVERAEGRYIPLDAAETLAMFMVEGRPDRERFVEVIGGVVERAGSGGRGVRVFGEMVALLAVAGNEAGAVRLEQLWNEFQAERSFSLLCAYPMNRLGGETLSSLVEEVCEEHSRITPTESYTALATPEERFREVSVLQQKARWLEEEIAQRKEAEARLHEALEAERAARAAAEEALRLRDEFLSIASHELKTPVTSVSGYAQHALRRLRREAARGSEWVSPALEEIARQADKLNRLVGQLLDVSRIEEGNLALERAPTDLSALVVESVEAARPWSAGHEFDVSVPPALTANVDPMRFEQVLTNLLTNAVKFSPRGGTIEVALERPRRGEVRLAVRDRGVGIPTDRRAQLFERFYQAHPEGDRRGIGLGLYICRQIAELHGGEVTAEFPPDGGTRIVVVLPNELEESRATDNGTHVAERGAVEA